MKQFLAVLATTIVLAGCASSASDDSTTGSPNLQLSLAQLGATNGSDTFYVRGPINVQLAFTVDNPTSSSLVLNRLDLASIGQGAFTLRTGSLPMNEKIAANGSTTITISAWAQARGGRLTVNEPVSVRGIAHFNDGSKGFSRVFTQTLNEFGRT